MFYVKLYCFSLHIYDKVFFKSLIFLIFINRTRTNHRWGLSQLGATSVPSRPFQVKAVDVNSTHFLWGRRQDVLPHHLGDVIAQDDSIWGRDPGEDRARRVLAHGGQKTLQEKKIHTQTQIWLDEIEAYVFKVSCEPTSGLKKPVSQNWFGLLVLIQQLAEPEAEPQPQPGDLSIAQFPPTWWRCLQEHKWRRVNSP